MSSVDSTGTPPRVAGSNLHFRAAASAASITSFVVVLVRCARASVTRPLASIVTVTVTVTRSGCIRPPDVATIRCCSIGFAGTMVSAGFAVSSARIWLSIESSSLSFGYFLSASASSCLPDVLSCDLRKPERVDW